MSDRDRGIYKKFHVLRADGKSAEGEKHENCSYFVLDLDHDKHAIPALLAYAESCQDEFPILARELRHKVTLTCIECHATDDHLADNEEKKDNNPRGLPFCVQCKRPVPVPDPFYLASNNEPQHFNCSDCGALWRVELVSDLEEDEKEDK